MEGPFTMRRIGIDKIYIAKPSQMGSPVFVQVAKGA